MTRRISICFVTLAIWTLFVPVAHPEECLHNPKPSSLKWEELEPGISYATFEKEKWTKPADVPRVFVHILQVDLSRPDLTVRSLRPLGTSQRLEEIAEIFDTHRADVRATINGDYYNFADKEKDPLGMHVSGGQVLRFPYRTTSLALTDDNRLHMARFTVAQQLEFKGKALTIAGANRSAEQNEAVLYSGYYLNRTRPQPGCVAVQLERSGKLQAMANNELTLQVEAKQSARRRIKMEPAALVVVGCGSAKELLETMEEGDGVTLKTRVPELTGNILEVISGGPRVLRAGKVVDETSKEGFSLALRYYIPRRHPRSAVGISRDGRKMFLLVAEGRINRSKGVTAGEAACIIRSAGASEAMLFDGGGSAALRVQDKMFNIPHRKRNATRRAIANALAVIRRAVKTKKR